MKIVFLIIIFAVIVYFLQESEEKGEFKRNFTFNYDKSIELFMDLKRLVHLNPLVIEFKEIDVDTKGFISSSHVVDLIPIGFTSLNITYSVQRSLKQKDKEITKFYSKIQGVGLSKYILNIENHLTIQKISENSIQIHEIAIFKMPKLLMSTSIKKWKDSHETMYENFLK